MLGCHDDIDIVLRLDAVIEARQQTVGIRRKIETNNVCLLVGNMIQETRILMRKAIMILLPDMRRQNNIERRNLFTPRQLIAHLEPLRMLRSHRINDARKRLIGIEETVTPRQQIALEPSFTHMF